MNPTLKTSQPTHEVERIARAERMLADEASNTLLRMVRDVAALCDISIHEMHVVLRPDTDHSPEPKAHFVITGARLHSDDERERNRERLRAGERSGFASFRVLGSPR